MSGPYQGWNLEEKERELHLIMAEYRGHDQAWDRPEEAQPDIRDITQVLNELNVTQGEIDSLTNRKRALIEEYHHLQERNAKIYDSIVNRPEEGGVSIMRSERYSSGIS